jgi:hypothetical protein
MPRTDCWCGVLGIPFGHFPWVKGMASSMGDDTRCRRGREDGGLHCMNCIRAEFLRTTGSSTPVCDPRGLCHCTLRSAQSVARISSCCPSHPRSLVQCQKKELTSPLEPWESAAFHPLLHTDLCKASEPTSHGQQCLDGSDTHPLGSRIKPQVMHGPYFSMVPANADEAETCPDWKQLCKEVHYCHRRGISHVARPATHAGKDRQVRAAEPCPTCTSKLPRPTPPSSLRVSSTGWNTARHRAGQRGPGGPWGSWGSQMALQTISAKAVVRAG